MPQHWRFATHDRAVVGRICSEMSCSPLLAQVLAARGLKNGSDARKFLQAKLTDLHDPALLPGASEAAERIVAAFRADRRITIYGDYDVDGITATSILWYCLKLVGAKVDYYIPSRLNEGYGLNLDAIRSLHEEDPQRLVITVDCGICSLEEAELAKRLGLELIVTDHHKMLAELPNTVANVHPRLPGSEYPFPELCGAGVAFKVAWAVCQLLGDGTKASPRMRDFLKSAVGLAALGTVADVVPLIGENRILVRYGLKSLIDDRTPGLEMLIKIAGLHDKKSLSSEDIAFALAPRLNAAGRLGQARLAVELLTTDQRSRAAQLADYLDQLNKNRQTVERRIFKQAKELVEAHPEWDDMGALVLANDDWHGGVIGIVASRIAEHFQKPTLMISINQDTRMGHGSGRSWANFDLYSGLAACDEFLESFGGHRVAAGLRVHEDRVEDFRRAFSDYVISHRDEDMIAPELPVDAEVSLHDLTHSAIKELDTLGPFGAEHPKPLFAVRNVTLAEPPTTMGGGGRHLALKVRQGDKVLRCIAFGKGDWAEEIAQVDEPFSICFSAGINEYRGYSNVELQLKDFQTNVSPVGTN
ncbi:MAG: single-stranded-DNA-specific exonuclease RecJ [Planctomycetaceae bacterium]|nr:single-stranded-DNA-specific exonuclease RecJ [Planctomycetaceae bacterium]